MSFELFKGKDRSTRLAGDLVSIWKSGAIVLNQEWLESHFKDTKFVQLMYDAEGQRIALKPYPFKVEHGYSLVGSDKRAQINAIKFLEHNEIPHPKSSHYLSEWNEEMKALIVNLLKPYGDK